MRRRSIVHAHLTLRGLVVSFPHISLTAWDARFGLFMGHSRLFHLAGIDGRTDYKFEGVSEEWFILITRM